MGDMPVNRNKKRKEKDKDIRIEDEAEIRAAPRKRTKNHLGEYSTQRAPTTPRFKQTQRAKSPCEWLRSSGRKGSQEKVIWSDSPVAQQLYMSRSNRENVDVEIEGFVDRLARVGNVSSPNCLVGKKVKKKRQESVDDTMLLRDRNTSSLMESWLMPSKDEKLYPGATTDPAASNDRQCVSEPNIPFSDLQSKRIQTTGRNCDNSRAVSNDSNQSGEEDALLSILDEMDAECSEQEAMKSRHPPISTKMETPMKNTGSKKDTALKTRHLFSPENQSPLSEASWRHLEQIELMASQRTCHRAKIEVPVALTKLQLPRNTQQRASSSPLVAPKVTTHDKNTISLSSNEDMDDFDFALSQMDLDHLEKKAIATKNQQSINDISTPSRNNGQEKGKCSESLRRKCYRLKVFEITQNKTGRFLSITTENSEGKNIRVVLAGDWYETIVSVNDMIHVILDRGKSRHQNGDLIVNNDQNMVILCPDILITPSTVTASLGCLRRAILQDCMRVQSPQNIKALYGTLKHDLFERALTSGQTNIRFLEQQSKLVIEKRLVSLLDAGLTEHEAYEELSTVFSDIIQWISSFVKSDRNGTNNMVEMRAGNYNNDKLHVSIDKILATEEMILSPMWGLKGATDGTIISSVTRESTGESYHACMPLELKTGSRSYSELEHRGQVLLYTLLLEEKYGNDPKMRTDQGILLYFPGPQTAGVSAHSSHLRGLILSRNKIAASLSKLKLDGEIQTGSVMPPMLRHPRQCEKCFQVNECLLYHAASEGGDENTSGLGSFFTDRLKHLSSNHLEYFDAWNRMLDLELRESIRHYRDIWLQSTEERLLQGNTLGQLCLIQNHHGSLSLSSVEEDVNMILRFGISSSSSFFSSSSSSLLDSSTLKKGDFVILSLESADGSRFILNMSRGTIWGLTSETVDIKVPSALNWASSEIYLGLGPRPTWRIDKDILTTGFSRAKDNLLRLFIGSPAPHVIQQGLNTQRSHRIHKSYLNQDRGDQRLCELIMDYRLPQFLSEKFTYDFFQRYTKLRSQYEALNTDQQHAIDRAFQAQDYCLILGMPGTGKTSSIVTLVRMLLAAGYSVLVTSYTHSALDHLLLKFMEDQDQQETVIVPEQFLRLGSKSQVHPTLQRYTLEVNHGESIRSTKAMKNKMNSAMLVGTTCLGTNHIFLRKRRFDYCIVDEAGQITQPVVFGPLQCADTFVLVGDHYQLPPLVVNEEARKAGMDQSLFRRLSERHPEAMQNLTLQYRMNADIMSLSNHLVYDNKLKCGNADIAIQSIVLPKWTDISKLCTRPRSAKKSFSWALGILHPRRHVAFLNTDQLFASANTHQQHSHAKCNNLEERHVHPQQKTRKRGKMCNRTEACIVSCLAKLLHLGGLDLQDIGIVTPFRAQVAMIQTLFANAHDCPEISTVDKYQGKDKQVIIISFVRSNEDQRLGDLLQDWRRMNVALTRSKCKLIIIGSVHTLSGSADFLKLLCFLQQKKWVNDLHPQALESVEDNVFFHAEKEMLEPHQHFDERVQAPSNLNHRKAITDRSNGSNNVSKMQDIENLVPPAEHLVRSRIQAQTRVKNNKSSANNHNSLFSAQQSSLAHSIIEEEK